MSEKLYSLLLRLFPWDFRERFGEESIQLFRDRFRDETGFWSRLRLWTDLICDLAVSLPLEHVRLGPEFVEVAHSGASHDPAFQILKKGSPRFGAWFCGSTITLVSLTGLSVAIAAVTHHPATAPLIFRQAYSQMSSPQQATQPAQNESFTFNAAERARVIDAVAADVREHCADREIGSRVADSLLAQERNGGYDGIFDPTAFGALVTHQMQDMTVDATLTYFQQPLPLTTRGSPTAEQLALKTLKRATIVGEPTAGAAHARVFFRVDDHFRMGLADAADARNTAEGLAETKLAKK